MKDALTQQLDKHCKPVVDVVIAHLLYMTKAVVTSMIRRRCESTRRLRQRIDMLIFDSSQSVVANS